MPIKFIQYALLVLLAITITSSLQTVGIILVIAMLITPGSTAFLLTKRFGTMLWISVTVSVLSSVVGAYSSYYFDILIFLGAFLNHVSRGKSGREVVASVA
jgi:manganese transport system permease protein